MTIPLIDVARFHCSLSEPDSCMFGTRWFNRRLTVATRCSAVAAKRLNQIPTVVDDSGVFLPIFDRTLERGLSQVYVLQ
jgi:hypothetical protein